MSPRRAWGTPVYTWDGGYNGVFVAANADNQSLNVRLLSCLVGTLVMCGEYERKKTRSAGNKARTTVR